MKILTNKEYKKILNKIEELENKIPDYVTDFKTKFLIKKSNCVEKVFKYKIANCDGWIVGFSEVNTKIYFKKGTEPDCDYLKEVNGKIKYFKNNVEVKCTK